MESRLIFNGEEELLDFFEDPWQGFFVFTTSEPSEVSSPATVQDRLEEMPVGIEAMVLEECFPYGEDNGFGQFAVRLLDPSLDGFPYSSRYNISHVILTWEPNYTYEDYSVRIFIILIGFIKKFI